MARNSGTSVPPSSMSQFKDAGSSSGELAGPLNQEPEFTLEVPVKSSAANGKNAPNPESVDSWGGWVEIENNPMIFSTLLREWGSPSIDVHEVVDLDLLFQSKPESIYGLILLSRWAPAKTENDITEAPQDVWFANQVQSYSCATVAIMNIIMNHPQVYFGKQLDDFRNETISMSPKDRGWALDNLEKIRDVHNSFGTGIDRAKVDNKLQSDFLDAEKKRKQAAKGLKKKGRKGKKKQEEEEEENGFHFIAYVPAAGAVWKMDGMERLPRKLGDLEAGDSWIAKGLDDFLGIKDKAEVNSFEVSLLSLVDRTDFLSSATEEKQMEDTREDWGPLLATLLKMHAKKGDLREMMD